MIEFRDHTSAYLLCICVYIYLQSSCLYLLCLYACMQMTHEQRIRDEAFISWLHMNLFDLIICLLSSIQELDIGIVCLKPAAVENSGFQPVYRSGSYSEKGPKQYMEDEFICIDDLHGHLGSDSNLPSPGAFYGVYTNLLFG